jgi:hypothetical protein
MDNLLAAYLEIYEANELEKRAKKNKEAIDTGFMTLSPEERKKESKRLDDLAKREASRLNEEVVSYLLEKRYAANRDSAVSILESMSDEWLDRILKEI